VTIRLMTTGVHSKKQTRGRQAGTFPALQGGNRALTGRFGPEYEGMAAAGRGYPVLLEQQIEVANHL